MSDSMENTMLKHQVQELKGRLNMTQSQLTNALLDIHTMLISDEVEEAVAYIEETGVTKELER